MIRSVSRLLAALAILAAGACAQEPPRSSATPAADAAYPVTITDDEGQSTTLDGPPDRIVTFAPSHTEIVFALGLGDRLVGVSGSFDDFPQEAQSIESVGGSGGIEPNIEKVVSLEPDVLLSAFIGGAWKERLRELDVPVFTTLASSLDDTLADIEAIGRLLGAEGEARRLAEDMASQVERTQAQIGDLPRVTCFLDFGDLFTVGPGSLEYDLLQRAGCDPITASAAEPYPQWSLEHLVADDPDVYLVSEGVRVERVVRQPGIRDLGAVRGDRVASVDPDVLTRPGPRVVDGLEAVAAALRGEDAAVR